MSRDGMSKDSRYARNPESGCKFQTHLIRVFMESRVVPRQTSGSPVTATNWFNYSLDSSSKLLTFYACLYGRPLTLSYL